MRYYTVVCSPSLNVRRCMQLLYNNVFELIVLHSPRDFVFMRRSSLNKLFLIFYFIDCFARMLNQANTMELSSVHFVT